jgi:hypothetical protein
LPLALRAAASRPAALSEHPIFDITLALVLQPACEDWGHLVTIKHTFSAISATLALLVSATAANAAGMNFDIENSSNYIITGFYTGENGEWSSNWMDFKLEGGESAAMAFNYDGPCAIDFYVTWEAEDGSNIEGDVTSIDICDANTIYFDGVEATYD